MYTGTLISNLMATVDEVSEKAEQQRIRDERELQEIFSMRIRLADGDQVFMGAA